MAAQFALLFLPLLPLAVVGIMVGLGVLPLAPLVSFVCALTLRRALTVRENERSLNRPLLGGLAAGIALLIALDFPGAVTRLGIQWVASGEPSQRERGLTLLTIRHYNNEVLDKLTAGRKEVLRQQTTETVQVLMR